MEILRRSKNKKVKMVRKLIRTMFCLPSETNLKLIELPHLMDLRLLVQIKKLLHRENRVLQPVCREKQSVLQLSRILKKQVLHSTLLLALIKVEFLLKEEHHLEKSLLLRQFHSSLIRLERIMLIKMQSAMV